MLRRPSLLQAAANSADVLPGVWGSTRYEDERSRRQFAERVAELDAKGAIEGVDQLIFVVDVERWTLPGSRDRFEGCERPAAYVACDLEGQDPANRVLD
jgi:hypothetical protein